MKKTLSLILLLSLLAIPSFASKRKKTRPPARSVTALTLAPSGSTGMCGDQTFQFTATVNGDQSLKVQWIATGGNLAAEGNTATINTKGVVPGTYSITAEVIDPINNCVAYDSKSIVVESCPEAPPPPKRNCFTGDVELNASTTNPSQGEIVTIRANPRLLGDIPKTIAWMTSAGQVKEQTNDFIRIDLTSVAPGESVIVRYQILTDLAGCGLTSELTFKLADPPKTVTPEAREYTSCSSFKPNSARVDNACKAILQAVVRQLQEDPTTRLVIVGSARANEKSAVSIERAKSIKAVLSQGGTFATIDDNRIEVRSGNHSDGTAKLVIVPQGAKF